MSPVSKARLILWSEWRDVTTGIRVTRELSEMVGKTSLRTDESPRRGPLQGEDEEYCYAVKDSENLQGHEHLCGDPNHLIGECSKPPKNNDQRAFIGGAWSDNGEDEMERTKDETCLVAQAPYEIMLRINLEPMMDKD
ncbi:hypothetical protein Tco_1235153 [Tanacetum coccineum]